MFFYICIIGIRTLALMRIFKEVCLLYMLLAMFIKGLDCGKTY